jgi:hypothetical protein
LVRGATQDTVLIIPGEEGGDILIPRGVQVRPSDGNFHVLPLITLGYVVADRS